MCSPEKSAHCRYLTHEHACHAFFGPHVYGAIARSRSIWINITSGSGFGLIWIRSGLGECTFCVDIRGVSRILGKGVFKLINNSYNTLGAVATKQGILLATITHHDIVPASNLTCLLPKRTIYGRLKCFISITYKLVSLQGGARAPKAPPPPLNTPLEVLKPDSIQFNAHWVSSVDRPLDMGGKLQCMQAPQEQGGDYSDLLTTEHECITALTRPHGTGRRAILLLEEYKNY